MKMLLASLSLLAISATAPAQALPLHATLQAPQATVLVADYGAYRSYRRHSHASHHRYTRHHHARHYVRGPSPDYGYYRGFYEGYQAGNERERYRLVDQGACGTRGMVRVCDAGGVCWAACHW